jgi:hypothetical protein
MKILYFMGGHYVQKYLDILEIILKLRDFPEHLGGPEPPRSTLIML